jgi:hypothetical protein
MNLLDMWAGWSLYAADTMQSFIDTFKNPPLTEEEKAADEKERKEREARRRAQKVKARVVKKSESGEKSEEAVLEEIDRGTPVVDKGVSGEGEKMDVDSAADGRQAQDTKMEDAEGTDDEKGIFGFDGTTEEHPADNREKQHTPNNAITAKAVISRGSKRPSTREMLDE